MHDDGAELRNQQAEHPEIVTRMTKELLQQIANGSTRSAEGL
jgi:hypothetical protein